jgi:hypothetical protein
MFAKVITSSLVVLSVACASGEGSGSSSGASGSSSTTSGSSGTAAAEPASSSLGTACETYYGTCCTELANSMPAGANRTQAVKACTDAKAAAEKGIAGGATAAQYESSCEQGIAAAKQAGKCK